jgi:uncharacterized protein (TIGR00255 family)
MIQSMTGYGRGTAGKGINKVTSYIKVVNGRHLDIKFRGIEIDPNDYNNIRNLLVEKLVRGTVHIDLELENNNDESISFNQDRFEAIENILLEIQKKYGRHLDMGDFITSNDLFARRELQSLDSKLLNNAVSNACEEVVKMRKTEGKALQSDLNKRLNSLNKILLEIEKLLPEELKNKSKKYKHKISDLLDDNSIDESRIAMEVAIIAEKSDVTEEIVRLKSHFDQFNVMISSNDPVGKRLNFLIQEISREINTIGSKTSSNYVINNIIIMKDEVEKIREQIQNIL